VIFLHDVRFALRSLRRTPAFPLAAIATLALGIGATTAIFSTVNAVLLRPLAYPQPENLYGLRTALTDGRVTTGLLSAAEVTRINELAESVVHTVGVAPQDATLVRDDGTPARTRVYAVSAGFFGLFGLPMTLGSDFMAEQAAANGPPVVVISYRVWQSMFGGDPAVVGKPIRFVEIGTTIAGVAPRGFDTPPGADFWFGVPLNRQDVNHSLDAYMRVKPGTTIERARSELDGVIAAVRRDLPESARSRVFVVRPLVESIVGDLKSILIVVLSATGVLLVLACVNVTNLLLARGAARAREMAVRVALGANRARIVRQLLTESILLATFGTVVGLAVASAGVRLLMALGASRLPRLDSVPFDGRVLGFALVVLVVSGLLVGFAPALSLARTDVRTLINETGRSSSAGRGTARWLGALTIAEVALAITLVAGAGWLIRSFAALRTRDPGFDAAQRLIFDVAFAAPRYRSATGSPDPQAIASREVLDRLTRIGGVTAVAATANFPLRNAQENSLFLQITGEPFNDERPMGARQRFVSPGFFRTMGIARLGGRDFDVTDRPDTQRVAVVNETFVRRYLAGRDPLTVRFSWGYPTVRAGTETAIVGIVEDVYQRTLVDTPEPAFYSSLTQSPTGRQTVVVHAGVPDPLQLVGAIRHEVQAVDPLMPVDVQLVTDLVGSTIERQRLGMTLMLAFGAAAVLLAVVGVYGVIAYATAQRHAEVATRLALGATPGDVFRLVLRQGRTLVAAGAVIGLALSYAAGRLIASRIYAVRANDPWILGAAAAVVVVIALLATMVPAYRASRLEPARALRPE